MYCILKSLIQKQFVVVVENVEVKVFIFTFNAMFPSNMYKTVV